MGLRLYSDSHPGQRTKQCVLRGLGGARFYPFYNQLQRSLTATISMSIYLTHVHAKQIIKSVTYTQSRFVDSMGKLKKLMARLGSIFLRLTCWGNRIFCYSANHTFATAGAARKKGNSPRNQAVHHGGLTVSEGNFDFDHWAATRQSEFPNSQNPQNSQNPTVQNPHSPKSPNPQNPQITTSSSKQTQQHWKQSLMPPKRRAKPSKSTTNSADKTPITITSQPSSLIPSSLYEEEEQSTRSAELTPELSEKAKGKRPAQPSPELIISTASKESKAHTHHLFLTPLYCLFLFQLSL
jgi:hypothetical protein